MSRLVCSLPSERSPVKTVMGWLWLSVSLVSLVACAAPYASSNSDELTPTELNANQQRAQHRLVLATAYFEQGQTDVALQEVRAALKIDERSPGGYNLLGLIHQSNNAPDLAQQSFERSLRWAKQAASSTEIANAHHNLGWLLCQQAHYEAAQAQFDQALLQKHYRGHSKTHMTAGVCHARAGHTLAARQSWTRSLELDQHNPLVRYQLALLEWQTQPALAQSLLEPLHTQGLGTPESLWLGVRVAYALSQSEEMQQLGLQLQQRYPTSDQTKAWIQRKFEQQ